MALVLKAAALGAIDSVGLSAVTPAPVSLERIPEDILVMMLCVVCGVCVDVEGCGLYFGVV